MSYLFLVHYVKFTLWTSSVWPPEGLPMLSHRVSICSVLFNLHRFQMWTLVDHNSNYLKEYKNDRESWWCSLAYWSGSPETWVLFLAASHQYCAPFFPIYFYFYSSISTTITWQKFFLYSANWKYIWSKSSQKKGIHRFMIFCIGCCREIYCHMSLIVIYTRIPLHWWCIYI